MYVEMSAYAKDAKDAVSHRGRAFRKLGQYLTKERGGDSLERGATQASQEGAWVIGLGRA